MKNIKCFDGSTWGIVDSVIDTYTKVDTSNCQSLPATCPPEPMATEAFLAAMDECKDDHRAVLAQNARKALAW